MKATKRSARFIPQHRPRRHECSLLKRQRHLRISRIPEGKDLANLRMILPNCAGENMVDIRDFALIESDLAQTLICRELLECRVALFELCSAGGVPRGGAHSAHLPPVLDEPVSLYLQKVRAAQIEHPNPGHLDLID